MHSGVNETTSRQVNWRPRPVDILASTKSGVLALAPWRWTRAPGTTRKILTMAFPAPALSYIRAEALQGSCGPAQIGEPVEEVQAGRHLITVAVRIVKADTLSVGAALTYGIASGLGQALLHVGIDERVDFATTETDPPIVQQIFGHRRAGWWCRESRGVDALPSAPPSVPNGPTTAGLPESSGPGARRSNSSGRRRHRLSRGSASRAIGTPRWYRERSACKSPRYPWHSGPPRSARRWLPPDQPVDLVRGQGVGPGIVLHAIAPPRRGAPVARRCSWRTGAARTPAPGRWRPRRRGRRPPGAGPAPFSIAG